MRVKVRVAVAVNAKGGYNAVGYSKDKKNEAMSFAVDGLDCENWREFYLTAELDVPDLDAKEVAATVEEVA